MNPISQPSDGVVVVTGAARGIGLAIAERFVGAGARVVLSDHDATTLEAAAAAFSAPSVQTVVADVTSAEDMARLAEAAGNIAVWINNAGLARHRPIIDYSEDEIDLMLAVNLKGTILGSQAALRRMAPRKRGLIINIISTAGLRGIPTETVYCAAKWGARGFTQGLREEAAPYGVRVSAILPGGVDTGFWDSAAPDRKMDRGRLLTAAQVAEAVHTLAGLGGDVVPQELVLRALLDRDFAG